VEATGRSAVLASGHRRREPNVVKRALGLAQGHLVFV
jgi:hypothetical protein